MYLYFFPNKNSKETEIIKIMKNREKYEKIGFCPFLNIVTYIDIFKKKKEKFAIMFVMSSLQ